MSSTDVVFGSFWHLSDLRITPAADDAQAVARATLLARADAARKGNGPGIDAVVVTGDLLGAPDADNAREANDFLLDLAARLELAPERVLVVPGRRDLDLGADDPAERARHFRDATAGCTTPDGRVRLHVVGESGLAFLLIDVLTAERPAGAARLLGRLTEHVPDDARDAWNVVQPWLVRALGEYARVDPAPLRAGGRALRAELLALAVSYLPLTSPPTDDSGALFPVPAGAGRAKLELLRLGVDGCLYGPALGRHVHTERLGAGGGARDQVEFSSVGGPSMHGSAASPAGFHVVEYARGCSAGEARVRVRLARLDGQREHEPELLWTGAGGRPARASRMTVKINEQGDARVDVWRQGVPTSGWEEVGLQRVARVPVQFAERNRGQREPVVGALSDGLRAEFRRADGSGKGGMDDGGAVARAGEIVLTADTDVAFASYAYRRFAPSAYATSLGDRVRGYLRHGLVPGLKVEQEACVQFLDARYRRAELFIRTPFEPTQAELRTYVRRPRAGGGEPELVEEPRLLRFSRAGVEWWGEARRIRAVIDRPLCGVGYGVVWTIPDSAVDMPAYDPALIDGAVKDTEALRREVAAARAATDGRWRVVRERIVAPFFAWAREVVRESGTLAPSEELEVALLLPTRPKLTVAAFRERFPDLPEAPGLGAVAATFAEEGEEFAAQLPAGAGVTGRAYVTNKGTEYVSPDAGRGRGMLPGIGNVYVPLIGGDGHEFTPHTVLYALPLRHWDVPAVVAGCLCVGSRRMNSRLELKWQHPETLLFAFQLLALEGGQMLRRVGEALAGDDVEGVEPWRPLPASAWRPVAASERHRGYWREVGPGLTTLFLPPVHPAPAPVAAATHVTAAREVPAPAPALAAAAAEEPAADPAATAQRRQLVVKLRDVLEKALPSEAALDALLYRTGRSLDDVLTRDERRGAHADQAFHIAKRADRGRWLPELLAALREELPDDAGLLSLAAEGGLLAPWRAEAGSLAELEARIGTLDRFYDPSRFVQGLLAAEWRICRVEVQQPSGATTCGTGFLVGPDRVLTCCHVVDALFTEGGAAPRDATAARAVTLRFDFRRTADGPDLRGVAHWLHPTEWYVAHSPVGALDYALLRIDGAPGLAPPGADSGSQLRGARARGWIELPTPPLAPHEEQLLFIMQHPVGEPLALAIGTQCGDLPADGDAVLRYTTRTEKGSSGAPCFDAQWGLVALHRGSDGGPEGPRANEGRLLSAIRADLEARRPLRDLGLLPLPT
ncbi:trypsin-like peptidase domain-containing protein [Roseisolibacter sp. H3M3-2]|uniref:trypsin-like peptidase domain-containing protein n=1 Tax=Roseisolibacter sp. H3M3-2 TaxID=3031323 RepID=UPI0023DA8C57|nr:trypsin-like peptidase domain-containing protein [Roseisolibacter sp. H3M3-2]MDF1505269.1 trypsin-like peptidase domain-containing protein [Roseisolibacter sp. H3M3-2]